MQEVKTIAVAITFEDESVGVMQFITDDGREIKREATDEAIQAEIEKGIFPSKAVAWRRIKKTEIPKDRSFRNAWRDKGKIEVDMPAAREIHKGRVRAMREPLLTQLDTDYMRADESGDTAEKQRIANLKQQLRDVTDDPKIEAAKDASALKKAIPSVLK
jgi:hypothetical protein